ncbi:MAG: ABC transporter permease subunit, partial [Chloroflexota bacterium]
VTGRHIVPHLDRETGEWISPPLAPSDEYPLGTDQWGNDILSMLLYGARNTLIAAAFIAMARIVIGLLLGAYAGWNEGKVGDRLIMGSIGVISAVPILISSMILIFALDIRRGLPVFIFALTMLGWTEIAQYIRGEFLILRKRPFVEGAQAAGASSLAIGVRHLLPNVLPMLLVLAFLEIAAVLLLFGELGFVGVFIGGGSHISVGDELVGAEVVTLAEVPEWGAMLAEGYRWLRAKPFIVFPPAMAFFVAVLAFNAFGEGLRRYIEVHHVNTNFLLSKKMLLVAAALTFATALVINNTGPAPWFAKVARSFDEGSAYGHTEVLTAMDGRGVGQQGALTAADYIAQKFEEYGLRPGWRDSRFINPITMPVVRPVSQPVLAIMDAAGNVVASYRHQLDFGYTIDDHGGSGQITAPVTFVGFVGQSQQINWPAFQGLDLRDRIVMLIKDNAPDDFANEALIRGARGILWVVGEQKEDVRSQIQLDRDDRLYVQEPTIPIFHIRPEVAQTIAGQAGTSLSQLLADRAAGQQQGPFWFARDLATQVHMGLALTEPQPTTIPAVMGYMLGSDISISNELVVFLATYDGLGSDPDGTIYPAANHNAAGIGVLLELARLWQEQELDPRRSVLFIAWGGGQLNHPGAAEFLAESTSFRHLPAYNTGQRLAPHIVIQLDYVGAGGQQLLVHPESAARLAELVQESAAEAGIPVETGHGDRLGSVNRYAPPGVSWLSFGWEDADVDPDQDTLAQIDAEKLQSIGRILSHVATQVVRQTAF